MGFLESLKSGYNTTRKESKRYYVKCPKCGKEIEVLGSYGEVKCTKCDIIIKYD